MNRLIIILISCLWVLGVSAQSYKTLWKQVEDYQQKDLPQSAIAVLRQIQQKATKEKSYGNLLAAMTKEINQQAEIGEDSMKACKASLKNYQQQCRKNGNGVIAVLCDIALGEGNVSIDSLLASTDAKTYTKSDASAAWVPFIDMEADSKYFHNDLLHVIGMEKGEYEALYHYYSSTADRKAACIAAALMLRHGRDGKKSVERADSLIALYKDLPECGAIAKAKLNMMSGTKDPSGRTFDDKNRVEWIDEALSRWPSWKENNELRNRRAALTQPGFHAVLTPNRVNTMMPVEITFSGMRNIDGVKVTMTSDKGQTKEFSKTLPNHEEWELMKDTLKVGLMPLGKWTVTISDTKGKIKSENQVLFVTDLRVIQQGMPGDTTRYVVVNDITGQPAKGAQLLIKHGNDDSNAMAAVVDDNGEYLYYSTQRNNSVAATLGDDTAMQAYSVWNTYNYTKPAAVQRHLNIYTDRSMYRPGQTVHVAVIRHDAIDGTKACVTEGDTVQLILRDSQYKQVEERTVITDEYGTATIDFTLPTEGRNGSYSIYGNGKATGSVNFSVEEYKRPTFDVSLSEPSGSYKEGDTLTVTGSAKTYSGVAVANARVAYKVTRQMAWWWRRGQSKTLLTDTVFTDSEGKFFIRMPMVMTDGDASGKKSKSIVTGCRFYNIVTEATVMDNGGESHSTSLSLPLSNRESYITCDIKDRILADTAVTLKVVRRNAAGKLIDGEVSMSLDKKSMSVAKANKNYLLPKDIASGKHTLMMVCGKDTLVKNFVVFRKGDQAPVTNTKDWFYASSPEFTDNGTWMQVGTMDRNVHVVYAIYSAKKVIEKGVLKLDGNNITRDFNYMSEYGGGITVSLAWVKDGKMYSHYASFKKPLPSNKLTLEWTSFRNKLMPGQKEIWTLKVKESKNEKEKEAKAVKAQLMAVLYDKSLDALKQHAWNYWDYRSVSVPSTLWRTGITGRDVFSAYAERKNLPVIELRFSFVEADCRFNPYEHASFLMSSQRKLLTRNMALSASPIADMSSDMALYGVERVDNIVTDIIESEESSIQEQGLRGDFSETAFFMPQLMTDANGEVALKFSLPQSVTTWKFMALAHDKEMRIGQFTDEAVAQKQLMLQAKMPRFLRVGDKGQITANVANTGSKQQKVNVTMTLLDGKTEKILGKTEKSIIVSANGTVPVTFSVAPTESMTDGIICRFMANGKNCSDGEQHLLTVLTDKEEQMDTTAFVVEPKKMMREALPLLAVPESQNAVTLANAVYANVMTAHLLNENNNDNKADITKKLSPNDNVLVQLLALQNSDGGFSWYSGMQSSKNITVEVLKTLVRMNKICGVQNNTELLLSKAFCYLETEMKNDMEYQKEHRYENLSSTTLDWLYALTLADRNGGTAETYFRKMLYEQTVKDNMQAKAVAGIVMFSSCGKSNNKKAMEAREYAEAIKQHTVYREDMGRYFDSYRAEYSWCDFRIPTQTMCIEALDDITPVDTATITEMQKWLVQSKRTQSWDNAINAVNAVYALSLNKAQKPFLAAYKVNPEDYKNIINVTRNVTTTGKVGDRVKVKITIVADRDYDFVTVIDNRAACMEPVNQMSGYHWAAGGDGYYQETKDQKTVYHFCQLRKGTHSIETEYYIDRAGSYNYGKTTAMCEYAQEFRGTADATKVEVK